MAKQGQVTGKTALSGTVAAGSAAAAHSRLGYHVAITQITEAGVTTTEEVRVLPTELYAPSRQSRVHDSSAYDAAIFNLCRGEQGFQLTMDRGPSAFQVDLPPTPSEIAKIQQLVLSIGLDPELKRTIAKDLSKQALAVAVP